MEKNGCARDTTLKISHDMKPNILVISNFFYPAYISGGPARSVTNLCTMLSSKFNFNVIASDRETQSPFPSITTGKWMKNEHYAVMYLTPAKITLAKIKGIINSLNYDAIYLNSFFNYYFTILPLILLYLRQITPKPTILAPRGEFSRQALEIRGFKKRLYIEIVKFVGLYTNVVWQASSEYERDDIKAIWPKAQTLIAPDLAEACIAKPCRDSIKSLKHPNELKLVFCARIAPIKNLHTAIKAVSLIDLPITFHIFGPASDHAYYLHCKEIAERAGTQNTCIEFMGTIQHEAVETILKQYHFLLMPTLGENFGHIIVESLSIGLPVIIGNTTPWRNLQARGVGWDIPPHDIHLLSSILLTCFEMDNASYSQMVQSALSYAADKIGNYQNYDLNVEMFKKILSR